MPIIAHALKERVKASVPQENVEATAAEIVNSLDNDYRAFTHASLMYNSDFFAGELPEFKVLLCRSLKNHFPNFPNSFWDKAVTL